MKLPPKGDPLRPLHQAGRSFYGLGALCLIPLIFALWLMLTTRSGMGGWVFLILGGFYGGIAALFLLLGYQIQKHRGWAIITGMVFSTLLMLWAVKSVFSSGLSAASRFTSPNFSAFDAVVPLVCLLFVIAFATLTHQLYKGRKTLQTLATQGFDVLPPTTPFLQVLPLEDPTPTPREDP